MKPYLQTTTFTTAASSLLAILHHFNGKTPLTREKEFEIWHNSSNLPTRASSIYGLATFAKQQGLDPKIIVGKKEYEFPDYRFYRYTKEDIEQASFSAKLHHEVALTNKIPIEERELSLADVKKELNNKNILLLRLNMKPIRNEKRNTSNYVVLYGFKDGNYYVMDPAFGSRTVHEEIMQEAFETLQTKKFRDNRAIIFSTSSL